MPSNSKSPRNKRHRLSSSVNTSLLGVTGLSAMFVLTACDSSIQAHSYTDLESCLAARVYTEWECEDRFAKAQQMHTELSPQYARLEDCRADYGFTGCESQPNMVLDKENTEAISPGPAHHGGGGFFGPIFLGYMMGRLGSHTTPLYRSARNGLVTPSGQTVPSSSFDASGAKVKQNSFKAPSQRTRFRAGQTVSSRGGFGRTGRSRSFGS